MKKEIVINQNPENGKIEMKCEGFSPCETVGLLKFFESQIISNMTSIKIETNNLNKIN